MSFSREATNPPIQTFNPALGVFLFEATRCFIEFGSGTAKGGKILYIWSTLLSSPQGQALLTDAVGWLIDATFRPPPVRINSITRPGPAGLALGFDAVSNLNYTLQYRTNLVFTNGWSVLQELGSSPVARAISVTNSISNAGPRFYRLLARP